MGAGIGFCTVTGAALDESIVASPSETGSYTSTIPSPKETVSPGFNTCIPLMRVPLMNVPLVEPRSWIMYAEPRNSILACLREISASLIAMILTASRPMDISCASRGNVFPTVGPERMTN
jgi:hypothetical protein